MHDLSRRRFLTGLTAVPIVVFAGCSSATGGSETTSPSAPGSLRPLPIPPLETGTVDADGTRHFELVAAAGSSEMLSGRHTPTWGYNGSILGPTLRARRGESVSFAIANALTESTSVHWHGMHVPARFDGGPHQTITVGAQWNPTWVVDQPAATLWYHPHPHGSTEKHVYRGLAGLFLVDDDFSDALGLPSDYGVDDIPLIIQDRRFDADGTLDESNSTDMGLLGDTIVTNGAVGAFVSVSTDKIRLRILNGSSGRLYNLGFDDSRRFQLVATDGGLLPNPVWSSRIALSPGERIEVVLQVTPGSVSTLRSFPIEDNGGVESDKAASYGMTDTFDILEIRAGDSVTATPSVPPELATLPALDVSNPAAERDFELRWFMINDKQMDMSRIDHTSVVDTLEVWTVTNADNWPHNFHVHDTQFRIIDIDGSPPPAELAGWKDTVYTAPGQRIRLALQFSEYTDPSMPYMYHCHLLMHEDQGMMGQFVVVGPGESAEALPMSPSHSGMQHN